VWHEKWGEEYAKGGDHCIKWTDRWSESAAPGGGQTQQGEKWREDFGRGSGNKTGEAWHVAADGHRCAPPQNALRMQRAPCISLQGSPCRQPVRVRPVPVLYPLKSLHRAAWQAWECQTPRAPAAANDHA
jgi:hypothetical protein